ncbi:hypothetical protein GCM10022200_01670 [Microbacterium awajiense]|uniref:Prepilin-type N-terminal cleavage/methylation domain-containing protein n=1 Tax=Microbacterium awajiense TaxID=415214 RepID=A0ABP7A1G0_9MICO
MSTPRQDDDGLSLIEVIVYVVVLGILMIVVTMIFINTWTAQASVASQTQATTRGQLVASQFERALRNAVDYSIEESGTVLKINTTFTGTRQCQGFALTDSGLAMTITSNNAEQPIADWPIWQDRVEAITGTTPFTDVDSTTIAYAFNAVSDSAPVRFTGDTYMRNQRAGMDGCWE